MIALLESEPEVERVDSSVDCASVESVEDLLDKEFVGTESRLDAKPTIDSESEKAAIVKVARNETGAVYRAGEFRIVDSGAALQIRCELPDAE